MQMYLKKCIMCSINQAMKGMKTENARTNFVDDKKRKNRVKQYLLDCCQNFISNLKPKICL